MTMRGLLLCFAVGRDGTRRYGVLGVLGPAIRSTDIAPDRREPLALFPVIKGFCPSA